MGRISSKLAVVDATALFQNHVTADLFLQIAENGADLFAALGHFFTQGIHDLGFDRSNAS
jgi:hypothetical protein